MESSESRESWLGYLDESWEEGKKKKRAKKRAKTLVETEEVETSLEEEEAVGLVYASEPWKLALVLPFALAAAASNALTLSVSHDIVGREPLPDLLHAALPQQDWAYRFGDYSVTAILGALAVLILFHKHWTIVARRLLAIFTVIFLFRSFLMGVTGMPPGFADAELQCQAPDNATDWPLIGARILEQLFAFGLPDGSGSGYVCGDMMFSGHTAVLLVGSLGIHVYSHRLLAPLRWASVPVAALGIVAMIISRAHYTIDILVSIWISTGFFAIYHAFTEVPPEARLRSSFRRMWWFWALVWLEEQTPARTLPNALGWPLPWPRVAKDALRKFNAAHPHVLPKPAPHIPPSVQEKLAKA